MSDDEMKARSKEFERDFNAALESIGAGQNGLERLATGEIALTRSGYVKLCELGGILPHPSVLACIDGLIEWEQAEREMMEDVQAGRWPRRKA